MGEPTIFRETANEYEPGLLSTPNVSDRFTKH
jgi:hypothetical protein